MLERNKAKYKCIIDPCSVIYVVWICVLLHMWCRVIFQENIVHVVPLPTIVAPALTLFSTSSLTAVAKFSTTRLNRFCGPSHGLSTVIVSLPTIVAPASMLFSTSSLTVVANVSTTWPEQILWMEPRSIYCDSILTQDRSPGIDAVLHQFLDGGGQRQHHLT